MWAASVQGYAQRGGREGKGRMHGGQDREEQGRPGQGSHYSEVYSGSLERLLPELLRVMWCCDGVEVHHTEVCVIIILQIAGFRFQVSVRMR